jgi:organic radical activating enzyme
MKDEVRINDLFWTFQGEGTNWGRRALFVRMPFCNLKCAWCDTEFNSFKKWTRAEFEAVAQEEPSALAVLTGGEPMVNKDSQTVIDWLIELDFKVACETNGMFPILKGVDFVTCSPKRESVYFIHDDVWPVINDLKIVVDEGFDFDLLKFFEKKRQPGTRLLLSPEFGRMADSITEIEAYIRMNPQWRLNLQTHKWLGIK